MRRVCYPGIRHLDGDLINVRDCVFVRSGSKESDIPYVAKIYALWEEGSEGWHLLSHYVAQSQYFLRYIANDLHSILWCYLYSNHGGRRDGDGSVLVLPQGTPRERHNRLQIPGL